MGEQPAARHRGVAGQRYLATRTDALPWLSVSERGQPLTRQAVNYLIAAAAARAGLAGVQARAAQLVLARATEIDGNLFFLLDPAARLIEGKHPLAATLVWPAMVEDTLECAKFTRYKHAARHLLECASLAPAVQDFGTSETHESFVACLRAKHSRKSKFWTQVADRASGGSSRR